MTEPTHIEPSELDYLRSQAMRVTAAQDSLQQYAGFLHHKYKLDAELGEVIDTSDGRIQRANRAARRAKKPAPKTAKRKPLAAD